RRLFLGSVAAGVVRHGHTSVLVARPAPESGLVLLAIDFSPASEAAAELAAEGARRRGARLCILHSVGTLTPALALAEPGVGRPARPSWPGSARRRHAPNRGPLRPELAIC